jgi:hypothetical protein
MKATKNLKKGFIDVTEKILFNLVSISLNVLFVADEEAN